MNRKILLDQSRVFALGENDVVAAMREFGAYLDITPDDFREIYAKAYCIARKRFLESIAAADIMSSPVLTVPRHMPLREAVNFLDEHNISGAPVSDDDGTLAGILSETDLARVAGGTRRPSPMHLLRAVLRREFDPSRMDIPVENVMTRAVVTVRPQTSLTEMLSLVKTRNINRLPVVDDKGRMAGLVSRTDILNTLGALQ